MRTGEGAFFFVDADAPIEIVDPFSVAAVERTGKGTYVRVVADQPDPEQAAALMREYRDGSQRETKFSRDFEKRIPPGTDVYRAIYGEKTFPASVVDRQARYDLLVSWVAAAGCRVHVMPETGPGHLYALFLDAVSQLDAEEEGKDWLGRLWRIVLWVWGQEERKQVAVREEKEEKRLVALSVRETIIAGVRGWYRSLPVDPEKAWEWISRRAVLLVEKKHHVLRPDGLYDGHGVSEGALFSQVRHLGMDGLISLEREKQDGTPRLARYVEVADRHLMSIARVDGLPEIDGGYLAEPDSPNGTLIVPTYRRSRKLVPTFHPGVDEWLRALAGSDRRGRPLYDQFCRHIGCAFAFENGGVAMICLIMPPSAGKKMFLHGLVEALDGRATVATGQDLVAHFNDRLLRSPFVSINEGLPKIREGMSPADALRLAVTGDYFSVNEKHAKSVSVKALLRLILTANNWDPLLEFGKRDLSPADREALGTRICSYGSPDNRAPVDLLRSRGGYAWTKGWIASDGREDSEYHVAKHFLWLYEQHGRNAVPLPGHGLLVEGASDSLPIELLRTQGGSTPIVLEAIVGMAAVGSKGLVIEDGRVYVLAGAILEYWRENLTRGSGERLGIRTVAAALRGLVTASPKHVPDDYGRIIVRGRRACWHELDAALVAAEAERCGWSCPKLEALVGKPGDVRGAAPEAREGAA